MGSKMGYSDECGQWRMRPGQPRMWPVGHRDDQESQGCGQWAPETSAVRPAKDVARPAKDVASGTQRRVRSAKGAGDGDRCGPAIAVGHRDKGWPAMAVGDRDKGCRRDEWPPPQRMWPTSRCETSRILPIRGAGGSVCSASPPRYARKVCSPREGPRGYSAPESVQRNRPTV